LGNYYAALTAMQLLDSKRTVFHNARIVDYPDFENRQFLMTGKNEGGSMATNAKELLNYKMNGTFISIIRNDSIPISPETVSFLQKDLNPELFSIYAMISTDPSSPVKNSGSMPDNVFSWVSLKTQELLTSGIQGIIAAPSFSPPADSSLCYRQPLPLQNNDGSSESLKNLLKFSGSSTKVFYCPVFFNNELIDLKQTVDYPDMITSGIPVLWSGSSYFSTQTDNADLKRYMEYTKGSSPVFIDNSMLTATKSGLYNGNFPYYPGKLKLFNLFEPFRNSDVSYLYELDKSYIFVNLPANGEIDIIRLATAADFFWNMNNYNPDYSLWKVLVSRYGTEASRDLIEFAGKYAELLDIDARLVKNEQTARNVKASEAILAEMDMLLTDVSSYIGSEHKLVSELMDLVAEISGLISSYYPETQVEQKRE